MLSSIGTNLTTKTAQLINTKEKATASKLRPKIFLYLALAAVLSEIDEVYILKKEQRMALRAFPIGKDVNFTPDRLWQEIYIKIKKKKANCG